MSYSPRIYNDPDYRYYHKNYDLESTFIVIRWKHLQSARDYCVGHYEVLREVVDDDAYQIHPVYDNRGYQIVRKGLTLEEAVEQKLLLAAMVDGVINDT